MLNKESCNNEWTKHNLTGIEQAFQENLIGQHLVTEKVPKTVIQHLQSESKKPLVLSFHGTPGTGKIM